MLLADLRKGKKAVISSFLTKQKADVPVGGSSKRRGVKPDGVRPRNEASETLKKMMAMGLLPGVEVQVMQKFPCYVVSVGYSQVALDPGLARAIVVEET